jgi:site-specific DNA-cytosine methylase
VPVPSTSEDRPQTPGAFFLILRVSRAACYLYLLFIDLVLIVVVPSRKHHESLEDQFVKQNTPPPTVEAHSPILSPIMAPKRKGPDAAFSTRPPRKKLSPSAEVSASHTPEAPLASTRRPTRTTRATINYSLLDTEDIDDDIEGSAEEPKRKTKKSKPKTSEDSDSDVFSASDNDQSDSSATSSELDMSSDQSSAPNQSDSGASHSDVEQPSSKRAKASNGGARSAAKSAPEIDADVDSAQGVDAKQKKSRSKPKTNMLNLNAGQEKEVDLALPPLFGTQPIFDDLVEKALQELPPPPESEEPLNKKGKSKAKPKPPKANDNAPRYSLRDVCKHVGSLPLRVATMCSGTESPLLAWDMISDCIQSKEDDLELKFEHVFSAEIVPYKQAYIERNFSPPIIFRDITEITSSEDGTATTAYGAKVVIPGNVDMVIAGTACVDFSKLNNQQKTLQERGESGDTFAAVLAYAKKYRPTMLVLENVFGAPWDEMLAEYEGIGYVSAGVLVDSKNYYLPQTRQRGYMVCIDRSKLDACGIDPTVFQHDFYDRMADFRRPVSSPLSSFILPNDDPLVTRANQSMIRQSVLDNSLKNVDWAKCEIRHINHRRAQELGIARPLTNWQESGTLFLPEYCNRQWFSKQVERVWDFTDMALLRKANPKSGLIVDSYDAQYKTRIWDVSQNIDRFVDGAPFGIASCLTPSGIFYITDRGGPLTFTESLMLQGLPLDRISFTTETERQIQDLAGNAMSTTVVGSAISSALIAGFKTLPQASAHHFKGERAALESSIACRDELIPQSPSQVMAGCIDVLELQADACKSATLCVCEGQIALTDKAIQTCSKCGHTSCLTCGVKPAHEYGEPSEPERNEPENFVQKWRPRIPMVLEFSPTDKLMSCIEELVQAYEPVEVSEPVRKTAKPKSQKLSKEELKLHNKQQRADKLERDLKQHKKLRQRELRQKYVEAVRKVPQDPFSFRAFRRASSWVIVYESSFARLELVLGVHTSHWKLYAKPDEGLSGEDGLRIFFGEPIATAQVKEDAFFGDRWQWRVPRNDSSFELLIRGLGQQLPSWAARLALPNRADQRVWSELSFEQDDIRDLPKHIEDTYKQIQGTYKLLPDCGTARESLYKRTESPEDPSMFLFLDPARIGNPSNDCFVFARNHSKLQYDQVREVTAKVDAAWRPELVQGISSVEVSLNGHWIDDDSCSLGVRNLASEIHLGTSALTNTDCGLTKALISLKFDLPSPTVHHRYQGQNRIKSEDKAFFVAFGWALEPLRQVLGEQSAQVLLTNHDCRDCSPLLPDVCWRIIAKANSREFVPYEDPKTARRYEHAIKTRPEPVVIECNLQGASVTLDIGLNTTTLCHRAAGKLKLLTGSVGAVSWKLDTSWVEEPSAKFPPFTLLNNGDNVEYKPLVGWTNAIELYPIQKKSLTWMKQQEEGVGTLFVVKEVEEALLLHLGWRLESEASTEVHVKGGILADHAGFGKTVTSLALIHSEFKARGGIKGILKEMHASSNDDRRVDIAATLVICPSNLVEQWANEVRRLLAYDEKDLVVIQKIDQLKEMNNEVFKQAKIIILDKTILSGVNTKYSELLAVFAALPEYTGKSTRALDSYLRDAASRVPDHLRIYEQQRKVGLKKHIQKLYLKTLEDPKYREYAEESKRVKGRAYEKKKKKKKNAVTASEMEDLEIPGEYADVNVCPLLEMFRFNRVLVDEFSYTEPRELVMYCNIQSHKRWALSATPRLKDTYDVSRMARFLGINLPVGASAPGLLSSANMSALRKDMTNLEVFETFREMPSRTTQKSIHTLSQLFLDTFLRQNVMRADQYPYQDKLVPITLHADNRLIYTDLSQKLNSQDMRMRKGRKRVNELSVMPNVTSAEEALLCVAAVFDPLKRLSTGAQQDGVKPGLEALVKQFESDHRIARRSLENSIRICLVRIPKNIKLFSDWVQNVVETNSLRDQAVVDEIEEMSRQTPDDKPQRKRKRTQAVVEDLDENQDDDDDDDDDDEDEKGTPEARAKNKISEVVNDAKAYVSSTRTLRFVKNALKHEQRQQKPSDNLTCDGKDCSAIINDSSRLHLSANCGHAMCKDCVEASKNLLGICPADGCEMDVKSYHLLHLDKLGKSVASEFGSKADELTKLLKKIEAQDEQAIVFVQGPDRIDDMMKILDRAGVRHYRLPTNKGGKASSPSFTPFTDLTNGPKKTVLILNSDDESAAGANLTNANHVVFFSPLLKRSQYEYEAQMAQTVGRVRRPGQRNEVWVYRFVSLDTVDVDILEHREHRTTVLAQYKGPNNTKTTGTDFAGKLEQPLTKAQKTQFICDRRDGEYKLVPRQMLLAAGGDGVFEGIERILGYVKFNSLIKFSSAYIQDD